MARFLSSAVFASALLFPSLAAASVVTTKSGGFAAVSEERLAFSTTPERTVAFEQLRLDSASGEIAWLVAVPKDATVEVGHAELFVALEQATAPRLSPARGLGCADAVFSTAAPFDEPLPEKALGLSIVDGSKAASALSAAGYAVDDALRAQLLDVEKAGERVAIVEIVPGATTPMLRVIGPAGRAMPTALLASPLARLRGFVIGDQRMKLENGPTLQLEFERIRWDQSGNSFVSLLDKAMTTAADGIVVTFASPQGLLAPQPLSSTSAISSVAERYLGDPACVARALASANSGAVVASAAGPGELAAATFSCRTRDDLAAALVGLRPATSWITRFEGIDARIDGRLANDGIAPLPSMHQVVLGGCLNGPGGSPPPDPSPSPSGGDDGSDGSGAANAAADACIIGLDSCSRSSSDSSSSGCGGDSSSSSGCGGDSSSSSDGCGGSSGSSGDSCSSGPHTSSADDGCRIAYRRPRRVRLSPIVLGLVAFATILRRRTRRAV